MESIKVLREICQLPRRHVDNWHMRNIARKPSIYITWVLLHTPLTATGATFLFLLTGFMAVLVFMKGTILSFFAGCLLLQFWYIMDMVDGEIARYKKQTSFTGVYFDSLTHYVIHPFVFVGIGLGLYSKDPSLYILLCSVLAGYSFCMITISTDIYEAVYYKVLCRDNRVCQHDHKEKRDQETSVSSTKQGILKKGFSLLHIICTFPTVMNIMLIISIVGLLLQQNLAVPFIVFYAFAATLVWIARALVFIKSRKIDIELAKG